MRAKVLDRIGAALLLFTVLITSPASAYDPNDPRNCIGFDWDDKQVVVVQKLIAKPRVNFVKSPYNDELKAETCPADTQACRKSSYLVTGDLVLGDRMLGAFTCVSYQIRAQTWATAWLPSAALTPVAPMASPRTGEIGSAPGTTLVAALRSRAARGANCTSKASCSYPPATPPTTVH